MMKNFSILTFFIVVTFLLSGISLVPLGANAAVAGNLSNYLFSGGGTADFNGLFVTTGEVYNNKDVFKYGSQFLWFDAAFGAAGAWVLGYALDFGPEYYKEGNTATPPLSGWQEGNGLTPPTAVVSAETVTPPYVRPNGNASTNDGWDSLVSYWTWGIVRPATAGSPSTLNSPGYNSGKLNSAGGSKVLTFDMSSFEVASVSSIKVWVYGDGGDFDSQATELASINTGGGWETDQDLSFTSTPGWHSATFSGSWTQTDLNNLQVRLTEQNPAGNNLNVNQVYAEITYSAGGASTDATLSTASTVKGETLLSLGTPNATITSATGGAVTLSAVEAADTSNAGSYITSFTATDAGATVNKVVKYASGGSVDNFATDSAYNNEAITTGDFFIVKITAEDNSTILYYKITVTVTPAPPTFSSAVTNVAGTIVTVTFSKAMASPVGKHAQFTVNNGSSNPVTAAALNADPTKIDLTVTNTILDGDTVTVAYTAGDVTSADTGILASFTAQSVTNNSTTLPTQTTPTFSPAAGAITFGTTVTISSTGAEAIYYTTNGSTPTTGSTNQAVTPLVINSAVTVKALAVRTGYNNSDVGTASYTQTASANLTGLALSGFPTGYTFAGGTYSYTGVVVLNAVSSITVTPTGSGTITVEGTPVTSGEASGAIALTVNTPKTITIVATETGKSAKTYTIEVTRGISIPTITSVSPSTGTTAGGTSITITGTGFQTGATVTVGGTSATSVTVVSDTSITAITPAGTAGSQNIVVTNTDTGSATLSASFTYEVLVSSGGGGGSGNYLPLEKQIAELLKEVVRLKAILAGTQGGGSSDFRFTRTLGYGMTLVDVKQLQILLNKDPDTRVALVGPGSPGYETKYFGLLTKRAVIKFQEKYATEILIPQGFKNGTGLVAFLTIRKLNSLLGQ